MNDLLQTILTDTYTLKSLHKRFKAIKDYYSAKFFNQNLQLDQNELIWLKGKEALLNSHFNAQNLDQSIDQLNRQAQELEVLTFYTAVDLTDDKYLEMAKYVRGNFNPNLLIDFKINPTLIAGCAMVWKGNYKDYSLKSTIDQNKDHIIERFKLFLK